MRAVSFVLFAPLYKHIHLQSREISMKTYYVNAIPGCLLFVDWSSPVTEESLALPFSTALTHQAFLGCSLLA